MASPIRAPRYQMLSVDFSLDRITVSFVDPNRERPGITEVTQFQVDPGLVEEASVDLVDSVEQFIDACLTSQRRPPDTIESRMRR